MKKKYDIQKILLGLQITSGTTPSYSAAAHHGLKCEEAEELTDWAVSEAWELINELYKGGLT